VPVDRNHHRQFFREKKFAAEPPQNSCFAAKRRNCIGQNRVKFTLLLSKCFGINGPISVTVGSNPTLSAISSSSAISPQLAHPSHSTPQKAVAHPSRLFAKGGWQTVRTQGPSLSHRAGSKRRHAWPASWYQQHRGPPLQKTQGWGTLVSSMGKEEPSLKQGGPPGPLAPRGCADSSGPDLR